MSELKGTSPRRISRWDLFKVFIASFFMQSVWNFRSLISVGFSACLFPVLNKLYQTPEEKKEFLLRHLRFFNAHPYLASFALGVAIRLEELHAQNQEENLETLDRMKELLIGPLGAIGDKLFWATIKPATLIAGMVLVLLAPTVPLRWLALMVVFLLYNIPHFYFRYRGIVEGYEHPLEIYRFVNQQRFHRLQVTYAAILIVALLSLLILFGVKLAGLHSGLALIFYLSVLYAYGMRKIVDNFYLISLATFIFFLTVGILFY